VKKANFETGFSPLHRFKGWNWAVSSYGYGSTGFGLYSPAVVELRDLLEQLLGVAVQVDPFESKGLKPGFSLHRLKG
jgi:hypothetical protein